MSAPQQLGYRGPQGSTRTSSTAISRRRPTAVRPPLPLQRPSLLHVTGCGFPSRDPPAISSYWTSRREGHVCAAATDPERSTYSPAPAHTPYPWHDNDYLRVSLASAPYGPLTLFEDAHGGTFNGVLVFKRDADTHRSSDDHDVLEVFVAGDTAFNTWSLLTHRHSDRPMVHELMWMLLERAHGADARNWALLRVAIVELRENVFIGRLWFGDKETGEVLWDCDARPSDGIYLSLRSTCPVYVHRRVWDQAALPIHNSSVYKLVASSMQNATSSAAGGATAAPAPDGGSGTSQDASGSPEYTARSGLPGGSFSRAESRVSAPGSGASGACEAVAGSGGQGDASWQGRPANPKAMAEALTVEDVALIRPDDPDAVKLLKRQLLVAVAEENYVEAARIRDHAWMRLYCEMHVLRLRGRYEDAHRVEVALRWQIETVSNITEQ